MAMGEERVGRDGDRDGEERRGKIMGEEGKEREVGR